jgi:hypothetical protein
MLAVLAVPVAAFFVANTVVDGSPGTDEILAVKGGGDADRPEPASRSAAREDPQGEGTPTIGPSASATISGPVVNGRSQPERVESPQSADGSYTVVSGSAPGAGDRKNVIRYVVEVEDGLPFDPDEFAAEVHRILNDPRGWGESEDAVFERVDSGDVRLRVSLSSPDLTDKQCYPLRTLGRVSCWNGARAVLNAQRWGTGADTFGDDLLSYREYLVNHEVGHALGHGHVQCRAEGEPSPVMVQQTKSLEGCAPNPWPEHNPPE